MEQHARTNWRTVLAGLAAALASGARIAQAQPRDSVRRLGAMMSGAADSDLGRANSAALVEGLGALGWHDGTNLRIDWRWAERDPALYAQQAAELIALDPAIIVAMGTPAVAALQRRTSTIPIVFAVVADPVGQGFVKSLPRPGGNITGFSNYDPPMAGKWLAMLTQVTPPVTHVAVLYDPVTAPFAGLMLDAIEQAAKSLKVAVRAAPVRDDAEIDVAIDAVARKRGGAVLILPSAFNGWYQDAFIGAAARHRVPAIYGYPNYTAIGGLMAYGIDRADLLRRAADYVDRILKGAKPRDLPVQNPVKFQLSINLKTAKTLGVTIAPALLATADTVIE